MTKRVFSWLKDQPVLLGAAAAALVSGCFVPFPPDFWKEIDFRVLGLLFALMLVVAGLGACGLWTVLAQRLLQGSRSIRAIALLLVLLPFFTSMLITNDVALITFVPFALLVLDLSGWQRYVIPVVVLQTVAANLGSMATPFGNPQNLFLYSAYELTMGDFFGTMGVLTLVSLLLLVLCCLLFPGQKATVRFTQRAELKNKGEIALYLALFAVSLLCVVRVLPWPVCVVLAAAGAAWKRPALLRRADYGLLLTFVFFFLFSANMGRIPAVNSLLSGWMDTAPVTTSVLTSQVISNVPAAVLLEGFTEKGGALLVGTNLGGLGTIIASLASLISFRFYTARGDARPGRYLGVFTLVNLLFLAVLLAAASL